MADLTKIVPSSITSSLTVSEVNGISLTKSKQNTESTLPATSFAEILEAQLSQNNIQTDETPTDAKQILPGQSVDSSLFGSLIVVVRDVEVPITENLDTPTSNENSKLFIPTVFTASTSSSVMVSQLPIQKPIVTENIEESSNSNEVLRSNILKASQNTPTQEQFAKDTQTVPQNHSSLSSNQKLSVSESSDAVEDSQNKDLSVPIPLTLVVPVNQVGAPQQIATNISSDSKTDKPLVSSGFTTSQQTPDIPNNQTKVNTVSEVRSTESPEIPERTIPFQVEKTLTPPPVANVIETHVNQKTEPVSATKHVSDASPRTLSSMLQSVQGLKMGIERTPTQQTFITVALPISEVQRLVVANPEVFTSKPQMADSISEEISVDSKSLTTQKPTISSQNNESNNVDVTNSENESIVIQTVTQNRENLFVPSSFVSINRNDYTQQTESDKTTVRSVSSLNRQEDIPKTQQTLKGISSNIGQDKEEVSRIQPQLNRDISVPNTISSTESEISQNISNTNERSILTSDKQQTFESIATAIENFATNLQTISTPKVSTQTQLNQAKEPKEFPFQAKIETISVKNTLVLEPLQKELIQKPNQAVGESIDSKYTVTKLLQKADEEGITIESIVVKIPVQSTKNMEVHKEKVLTTQQQSISTPLIKDVSKPIKLDVTNETKEVSIPVAQSSPKGITQNSKETPTQPIHTPIQQGYLGTTIVTSKESTPIENHAVKQTDTQNEQTYSTKEVAVQKTETSSNSTQRNSNFAPRKDVASILQRVENIQQKNANVEVNNQTSTTNTTENIFKNQVSSPKVTSNLSGTDSVSTSEVISNQPIEVKNAPIVKESNEQELPNELTSISTVGVNQATRTTTPTVPVVDSKILETPVSVEELPEAIVQEFVTDTTTKGTKATFTLNPEQLGKVQVEVTVKDNNASITLESSHKETIPMLEKQIDTLKEQLKTSNIIVEKLEVVFKPAEIIQPSTSMNDTFTNSQQMEQQSLQQEIDRQSQQQQRQNNQPNTVESENTSTEEIQPKRFGDGSSIIEEYI